MPAVLALLLAVCALSLRADNRPVSRPLAGAACERTRLAKSDLASLEESGVSIMPEGILEQWRPPQLRDLFAYREKRA